MTAPDDASELTREMAIEHVNEIVFDGMEAADPECLLCQHASELGLWKQMGFDDPMEGV